MCSTEEDPCSKKDLEEVHHNTDHFYAVNKIVQNVRSVDRLKYVVQKYGYSSTDDCTKQFQYILQHFMDAYWRRFERCRKRKTFVRVNQSSEIVSAHKRNAF